MIITRRLFLRRIGVAVTAPGLTAASPVQLRSALQAATPAKPDVFNPLDYGANGDGVSDCTAALRIALDKAARAGGTVFIPRGRYAYADTLPVRRDVTVVGAPGSELVARSERQALHIVGDNVTLRGLSLHADAVVRKEANHAHAIAGIGVANLLIESCSIAGASAAGIYLQGCRDFVIRNNMVVRTLADTIHLTGGSANGVVSGNTCLHGGDDGVAVVSYASQRVICRNISITDNVIGGGNARGIAVCGGSKVRIRRNQIRETKWAGIYLASEESYDTYGTSDISIEGNELVAANRSRDGGSHACITIVGRPGKSIVRGSQAPNQNSAIHIASNTVRGDGKGALRIDQFARGVTAIGNVLTDTDGWGIQTAALDAAFVSNRIERAALGGIVIGRECLGGNTKLIANEIHLSNGRAQPAIVIEPSDLAGVILQRNQIQYNDLAGKQAIQVAGASNVERSKNAVNGQPID